MAGIITSVEEDIKKLQELKQAIADVKNELKGINIKVDIDIKENLEKQLQGLMKQYNDVAERVSEVQGKIMLLKNDVQKAMEAQSPAGDISKLITDGLRNMEQSSQSASQSVESLNDALDHNKQEIESNTQALNENAAATEKVRLSNAQLVAEISEIANTDYESFVTRATNGTQSYTNAINQANSDIARLVSIQGSLNERFQAEEIGVEEYKNAMDEVQAAIQRTEAAFDSLRDAQHGNMGGNIDTSGLDKLDENVHILLLDLAELEVENGKTKQSLRDLNKEFKDGNITEEDYIRKKAVIQNSLDEEAKAIRDVKTELKLQRQVVEEVGGSYNQLSAQYSLNKIILNRLSEEQLQDTEEYNKLLKETESIYERMKQYQASTGKHQLNVGNYPSFSDSFKDVGNVEGLKEKFEEASFAIGEMQRSIGKLSQTSSEYVAKGQELRNEISTLTSSFNEAVKNGMPVEEQSQAIDTIKSKIQEYGSVMMQSSAAAQAAYKLQQDSIKALESELTNLQTALQTALAGGNTESADALAQEIANVSEELAKAKDKLEDLSVAAQNTKESFNGVAEEQAKMVQNIDASWLDRLRDGFSNVGNSISEYTSKITNAATGNGKFQQSLSSFKDGLNQLPIPLGKSVDGVVAMTRAMLAMVATPVGAVLAGIVLALQALFQWFTKDAEGQRVFAKASAYLGSLLSSMTDIIITIGKYLYHVFADAGAPLNSFTKSLKTTFVSAVKTVSELVGGLGKTLKGIFTMDWDTFKDGVSEMGKGLLDAGKTIVSAVKTNIKGMVGGVKLIYNALTDDNLAKDIGKHWNDSIPKAKESAALAERETNARIEAQKAQEKAAKLDAEIAKKREKIYTLTGKAKDAAIEETKALMKAKYDDQIKVQKEQLDILKTKNSLHTSSLEDLAKERDLNIQLLRTQAQREASTRMMTRMQQSNLNKMKTSEKGATSKSNALTAADTKWEETLRKNANERVKVEMDIEDQITEARIKAMEDGAEKIRAERERQNEKELDQIKKQRDAAIEAERNRQKAEFDAEQAVIKASGGKTEKWDESKVDETFINKIKEQYEEIYNNIRKAQEKDLMTAELTAMRDYLKEYGTFQQQKLAIAQEYAEKIEHAVTEGERLSLQAEMQKALSELNFEQLKIDINWESVFGNLENMTKTQLQNIKKQLQTMLNDKSLNVEQYKVVVEQIEKVNDAIVGSQDKLKTTLGLISPELQERKRIELEIADAEQRQNDLMEQQTKLTEKLALQRQNLSTVLGNAGVSVSSNDLTSGNAQRVLNDVGDKYGIDSDIYKNVQKAFDEIADSEIALNDSTQKLKGAMDDVTNSTNKLKVWSDDFGKKLSNLSHYISLVNSNMQDLPGLLEQFGVDMESGFGQGVTELSNATQSATNAFSDFSSGNFVGAASNALSAISSFGKSVTSFITGGGNEAEMEAEIAHLSAVNKELAKSIDNLSDRISASDATNKESLDYYKQALAAEKEREENQRKSIKNRAAEYANSGYGFLGMGGKHSFSAYVNDNLGGRWGGWSDFNNVLKEHGYDSTVNSWGSFLKLSPEEMEVLRDFSPQRWQELFSQGGHRNPLELVNEYIEMSGTIDDLTSALNEKLTGYSWEGFLDSYKNLLKDMTSNTEDFADNINDIITNALVNSFVNNELKPKIKELYEYIAQAAEDGIDSNERANIERMNEDIANYGIAWRQAMADAGMLKDQSSSTSAQTATVNTTMSITEDTGKAIDGRLTAVQIGQEKGNNISRQNFEQVSILNVKFDEFLAMSKKDTELADNMLDIMASSYLELQEINENTGSSARSLVNINNTLTDMKRDFKNKL